MAFSNISAEIHFHEQDILSVFVQSNVAGDQQRIAEIGLLAFYAVRMLCNFGFNDTSDHLATFLVNAPTAVPLFASGQATGGFKLISYPGYRGRYYFLASLDLHDVNPLFDFKAKGFGFLGRGLGYYGPMSAFGLLRRLAMARSDDATFQEGLGQAAMFCGQLHLNRQLAVAGQNKFALMALALGESIVSPDA